MMDYTYIIILIILIILILLIILIILIILILLIILIILILLILLIILCPFQLTTYHALFVGDPSIYGPREGWASLSHPCGPRV